MQLKKTRVIFYGKITQKYEQYNSRIWYFLNYVNALVFRKLRVLKLVRYRLVIKLLHGIEKCLKSLCLFLENCISSTQTYETCIARSYSNLFIVS